MAAALVMCLLGPLLIGWDQTVATHYDITLRADKWGHAGTHGLFLAASLLVVFGALVFAGRKREDRVKVNAAGLWAAAIFLALATFTFSRPRFEAVAVEVVATGAALFLIALTATIALARRPA